MTGPFGPTNRVTQAIVDTELARDYKLVLSVKTGKNMHLLYQRLRAN